MRYKEGILTRIESLELQLSFLVKNISSATISAEEAVKLLAENLRKLESIKELIEAE